MNNADFDPYQDRPIPNQQPLDIPRLDEDHQWDVLDGQIYEPSPMIVPDTQIGFDIDGNFHSVEHFTAEALNNVITPFRWADYLQDALLNYIGNFEYTVGRSERDDIVQDIIAERMENLDTMAERQQLEEAYYIWQRKYRYGIRP